MNDVLARVGRLVIPDPANSVLTLCARPRMPKELVPELARRAKSVGNWNALLALAEEHGLSPLLYSHLKDSPIEIPEQARRQLRALYLRHRVANEVLLGALGEVLQAFDNAQIEARVLKGPALVSLVYHDPALRPISDLDLLVAEGDALRAQRLLGEMGFAVHVPAPESRREPSHHLPGASRWVEGTPVLVEIHREALSVDRGASWRPDGAMVFELGARQAKTLTLDDMLRHLCRHLVGILHPFRLIWAADILGFAEAHVEQLDWHHLKKSYPFVHSTISLLHCLTPMPESVLERAGISVDRCPHRVGEDYSGWPRATAFVWDNWAARLDFLRRTFNPSEWWLRLNYGTGITPAGRLTGWLRHLAALMGVVKRANDVR